MFTGMLMLMGRGSEAGVRVAIEPRNGLEFWRTWSRSWRCSRSMIPTWSWRSISRLGRAHRCPVTTRQPSAAGSPSVASSTRAVAPANCGSGVPTRNGAATIGAALEAIGARLCSGNEIIVVENRSTERDEDDRRDGIREAHGITRLNSVARRAHPALAARFGPVCWPARAGDCCSVPTTCRSVSRI